MVQRSKKKQEFQEFRNNEKSSYKPLKYLSKRFYLIVI